LGRQERGLRPYKIQKNSWFYELIRSLGSPYFFLRFRVVREGERNVPSRGPAVLLVKHQFWTDVPLLTLSLKPQLYYLAKKELFENPLFRIFFLLMGGIPLDRERPLQSRSSLRYIKSLLEQGQYLVVFPEGTYYPYRMGPVKTGIIQLLLKYQREGLGFPFLPVGINYGKGSRPLVRICFGPALYPAPSLQTQPFVDLIREEIARCSSL